MYLCTYLYYIFLLIQLDWMAITYNPKKICFNFVIYVRKQIYKKIFYFIYILTDMRNVLDIFYHLKSSKKDLDYVWMVLDSS